MKRRTFLLVSSSSLLTGCVGMMSMHSMPRSGMGLLNNKSPNTTDKSKLFIPPILEGVNKGDTYHYNLRIQKAKHRFFKDTLTHTYAINGSYLAPTLKLINGQKVSINYINMLDEMTTMHGHGMHLPARMDGTPHQKINAGSSWSAIYKVKQKACTNWYHPHPEGKTAKHVYKGLAGFIIIEDKESQSLNLPKRYGIDDIPLVLQDRFFDENAQLLYAPNMQQQMMGYKGDTFIANGTINPYIDVEAKELRLRILNGSNSTIYNLKLDNNNTFKQIATDNSFLEQPVKLNSLRLSPGERAEIIIDLQHALGESFTLYETSQNKTFVQFNVTKKALQKTIIPSILTKLSKYALEDAVVTRRFTLSGGMGGFYINKKRMDMHRIDEIVPLNQIEIWEIHNQGMMGMMGRGMSMGGMGGMEHNFHIHGTHFMIVERNGSRSNVLRNERGYKDTVYLAAGDSVKLIVKMTDYRDSKIPYMYHCHFLEHEDKGMMGQFIVG